MRMKKSQNFNWINFKHFKYFDIYKNSKHILIYFFIHNKN